MKYEIKLVIESNDFELTGEEIENMREDINELIEQHCCNTDGISISEVAKNNTPKRNMTGREAVSRLFD